MHQQTNLTRGRLLLLIAVIAYWLSPIDALPGLPFDDLAVVILAWLNRGELAPAVGRLVDELLQGGGHYE